MRSIGVYAVVLAVFGGLMSSGVSAEDGPMKALPTLLIKGEVVSLDSNDPAAMLLKVKDRYGFETPIFITPDTKVTQGQQAVPSAGLQTGTPVEIEYSFDINTAKRYAVAVKVPTPGSETPAAVPAEVTGPTSTAVPAPADATPAPEAPAAPAAQPVESAPTTTQ